jgi:sterol desaturase/sphingolipid hydroxylase (fatty acid hydroxylase superfamily)
VIAAPVRSAAEELWSRIPQETAVSALVITFVFSLMLLVESRAPLRAQVESKLRRVTRNLSTGGVALAVSSLLQPLILLPVIGWIGRERIGLLNMVEWPSILEIVIGIVLLDYTLWWWHWANHRVPVLWRFHLVHHADLDMDSSTALRFHFGELSLSLLYRAGQIVIIGAGAGTLWIWQTVLFAAILFHHGNIRLPLAAERVLVRFVVTPRMHAIHHSDRQDETDSNWSSILSVWDVLHRTLTLGVPQREIRIGVPAYRDPADTGFWKINGMPFVRQRESWSLSDGSISRRGHAGPSSRLAE